jgi:hypothetical protein
MSQKKKLLLNFLWFLIGMSAIVAIPLLVIERCSEAGKPEIRDNHGQQRGSIDNSHGGVANLLDSNYSRHTA